MKCPWLIIEIYIYEYEYMYAYYFKLRKEVGIDAGVLT